MVFIDLLNDVIRPRYPDIVIHEIEGGFHIKDLPDGQCIDLMTAYDCWDLVRTDGPAGEHITINCIYHYPGASVLTLLEALIEALNWDGTDTAQPSGWSQRAARLGEWIPDAART